MLRPALVGAVLGVERVDGPLGERHAAAREGRPDEDGPIDALRMLGGEQQAALAAERKADDHRALGPGRVEHRKCVVREPALVVPGGLGRPVGLAVAPPVERDHAAVAREIGDLHLPVARVHHRPGRQQEHGRLALAVDLVEDADAVAFDVALRVRVAGAGLLVRLSPYLD